MKNTSRYVFGLLALALVVLCLIPATVHADPYDDVDGGQPPGYPGTPPAPPPVPPGNDPGDYTDYGSWTYGEQSAVRDAYHSMNLPVPSGLTWAIFLGNHAPSGGGSLLN